MNRKNNIVRPPPAASLDEVQEQKDIQKTYIKHIFNVIY